MKKLLFAAACAFMLSACGPQGGMKKQGDAMAGGVQWTASVYSSQRRGSQAEVIGKFDSHAECADKAMMHIKEKGYADGAYSCSA